MPSQIVKRDGRKVEFNPLKITEAIRKCFIEVDPDISVGKLSVVSMELTTLILKEIGISLSDEPGVEEVQDIVERTLMTNQYYDAATVYIRYRNHRNSIREGKIKLMNIVGDIIKESNRDNANVGNSPSAKLLQISEAASKEYYIHRMIPKDETEAHLDGLVYINDAAWYGITFTCLQIPLRKLLGEGFDNGKGYIRTPKSIKAAGALAAIIMQSCQNELHENAVA